MSTWPISDSLASNMAFRRAANADAEDARRAPAGAHGREGLEHPVDNGVGGLSMTSLDLFSRAAAFGRTGDVDVVALDDFVVFRRGVVFAVLAGAGRVEQDRGARSLLSGRCRRDARLR